MNSLQKARRKLLSGHRLSEADALALVRSLEDEQMREQWRSLARQQAQRYYGKRIYLRGLIEFSNVCIQNCHYCGLRRENTKIERYRLSIEEILATVDKGLAIGFGSLVLQGGEDPYWSQDRMTALIQEIRRRSSKVAITLSLGVRTRADFLAFKAAGADRYLLRHETADPAHFARLHPPEQSFAQRAQALRDLHEAGFVIGAGMMIGSPGQSPEALAKDLLFLQDLQPQMVGMGPFLPQADSPLGQEAPGSLAQTYGLLALVRLLLPKALLPATTAVGSAQEGGRREAVLSGANVIMPNLSPPAVRDQYAIYDHKLSSREESAEGLQSLKEEMHVIGYEVSLDRGDPIQ